jgi:hypothetical protein
MADEMMAGPAEGANPLEMVTTGLQALLEAAPNPEIKARVEGVMAELGNIATMLEGGALPEQAPGGGASPVDQPQGRPVGPAGV